MGLILVIIGVILLVAGGSWFAAATTLGIVLTAIGGLLLLAQIFWARFVVKQYKSIADQQRDLFRRF